MDSIDKGMAFEAWKEHIRNSTEPSRELRKSRSFEDHSLARHAELDDILGSLHVFIHKLPLKNRLCDIDVDDAHTKIKEAFLSIRKLIVKVENT